MMDAGDEGIGAGEMKGLSSERVNRAKHAALIIKTQIKNVL